MSAFSSGHDLRVLGSSPALEGRAIIVTMATFLFGVLTLPSPIPGIQWVLNNCQFIFPSFFFIMDLFLYLNIVTDSVYPSIWVPSSKQIVQMTNPKNLTIVLPVLHNSLYQSHVLCVLKSSSFSMDNRYPEPLECDSWNRTEKSYFFHMVTREHEATPLLPPPPSPNDKGKTLEIGPIKQWGQGRLQLMSFQRTSLWG